jgi:hypothetical protein
MEGRDDLHDHHDVRRVHVKYADVSGYLLKTYMNIF